MESNAENQDAVLENCESESDKSRTVVCNTSNIDNFPNDKKLVGLEGTLQVSPAGIFAADSEINVHYSRSAEVQRKNMLHSTPLINNVTALRFNICGEGFGTESEHMRMNLDNIEQIQHCNCYCEEGALDETSYTLPWNDTNTVFTKIIAKKFDEKCTNESVSSNCTDTKDVMNSNSESSADMYLGSIHSKETVPMDELSIQTVHSGSTEIGRLLRQSTEAGETNIETDSVEGSNLVREGTQDSTLYEVQQDDLFPCWQRCSQKCIHYYIAFWASLALIALSFASYIFLHIMTLDVSNM